MIKCTRQRMTPATRARKVSHSIGLRNIPKHFPTCATLVYRPFSNQRPKKLFLIRHCCETLLFFLRIQSIGRHVCDPKTYNTPLEVDLESSRSRAKEASEVVKFIALIFVSNRTVYAACLSCQSFVAWSLSNVDQVFQFWPSTRI